MKPQDSIQDTNLTATLEHIAAYNDTTSVFPDQHILPDLFFQQVVAVPENIAIVEKDRQYTYAELGAETDRFATLLHAYGLKKNTAVVVLLEPGFKLLATMLAILKSGCYYVPVDVKIPPTHMHYMVSDSNPGLVFTSYEMYDKYVFLRRIPVCFVDEAPAVLLQPDVAPASEVRPEDIAYIMYTSGSTGRPKRVAITHRSLVNYCFWAMNQYCQGNAYAFPLTTSISFDLTITSLFVPLISGGSIVVYTGNGEEAPILEAIRDNQSDIVKLTPSQLQLIAYAEAFQQPDFNSRMKAFIVGGEDLTAKLCRKIIALFGDHVQIYNEYGPTEATVGCMIYRFDPENDTSGLVPAGKPASNARIYLLDEQQQPVTGNKIGEIYIAGIGLANGYYNNPEMTALRFMQDAFVEGETMYKSGDLGRWNDRGELECAGRVDREVVLNGQTVLLMDIEQIAGEHDDVFAALALVRKDAAEMPLLYLYIIPEKNHSLPRPDEIPLSKEILLQHLDTRLPAGIVVHELIFIENFPLSLNDKIAIDKLPVHVNAV